MIAHSDKALYHIYPLSYGTDKARSFSPPGLEHIGGQSGPVKEPQIWADHLLGMGCNTLLLGPLWLSESHGYDTIDYRTLDPRVGTWDHMKAAVEHFHSRGIDVVLDGVFNHSARSCFAFRDLAEKGPNSHYRDWYKGLDFSRQGPDGLGFAYSGWHGYMNLPEFRLEPWPDGTNPPAAQYLLDSVELWIRELGIDGLRLDAADCLDHEFMRRLSALCKAIKPGFWLMGEVIHGNYGAYIKDCGLDSVTNYEAFKGLWSSHNDLNYHEIAWTLQREFGHGGTCTGCLPATFTDNHDTSRVASLVKDKRHLYPLWCMALTMPGIPTVYCGSESGWQGTKQRDCDWNLRPALAPEQIWCQGPHPDLGAAIGRLMRFRQDHGAIRSGSFVFLGNSNDHLAFARSGSGETLVVVVNARNKESELTLDLRHAGIGGQHREVEDILNPGNTARLDGHTLKLRTFPEWAQVFRIA